MPIIVSEEDSIRKIISEEVAANMRSILRELGVLAKDTGGKPDAEWLSIEDAKKIVPIKSKKKWKEVRDKALINFAKVGKGFIYEKESLEKYILSISSKNKPRITRKYLSIK